MTENNHDLTNVNHVYARDRAAVVATAVLAVIKDALDDPELRARVAATLRFEFADIVREVFDDRPHG
jgi:uncharacterized protein (DUF2267 family)